MSIEVHIDSAQLFLLLACPRLSVGLLCGRQLAPGLLRVGPEENAARRTGDARQETRATHGRGDGRPGAGGEHRGGAIVVVKVVACVFGVEGELLAGANELAGAGTTLLVIGVLKAKEKGIIIQ